jgi:pimeloyl-ACP methyl ester carboxylesterase
VTETATMLVDLGDRLVQVERGGAGTPLLYLHGALGEGYWSAFHDALAGEFDVIVPAHPGYWDSTRPDWIETPADLALHYVDLIAALGLERPVVVGSSLGGWIAAELALLRPDALRAVVLVDPAGLPTEGGEPPDIFALQPFETAELLFVDQENDVARLLASLDLDDPPGEEIMLPVLQMFEASARYAWRPYDPKLPGRLRLASLPVLVAWGAEDRYLDPATAERWASLLPDARVERIEHAGHLPVIERPAETARAVSSFVRALGPGPAAETPEKLPSRPA